MSGSAYRARVPLGSRFPLRTQLVAALVALLAVALVATGVAAALVLRSYLLARIDERLLSAAGPFKAVRTCRSGPAEDRGPRLPSEFVVVVFGADGQQLAVCSSPAGDGPAQLPQPVTLAQAQASLGQPFDVGNGLRGVAYPIAGGSLVVASSTDGATATVRRLVAAEVALGLVALAVLGVLGWWAVTRSLRPLRRIEETAEEIAGGELSRRVPETGPPTTEVGRLSRALNGMLTQIERAFRVRAQSEARMRRFVADASHELRTPLTSIRGFAELYRQGALRDPDEVGRAMRRIEDESVRMHGLVEDLLLLARVDEERPLVREPVDVAALVAETAADARVLAPDRGVGVAGIGRREADNDAVTAALPPGLVVPGDEARLRQVLANLVSNALVHTPRGTPIELRAGAVDGSVVVEVADRGPGLTKEQAAHVFDRFYRVDAARTRASGGAGLGLSIVSALVAAHGGRVGVRSAPGEGATFWLALPLDASQEPPRPVAGGSQDEEAQWHPGESGPRETSTKE